MCHDPPREAGRAEVIRVSKQKRGHLIPAPGLPARAVTPAFRNLAEVAAELAADVAFRHRVRRLHARGPRLIAELLAHIAADRALGTYIDELIDSYLRLDDEALDLVGGRNLPPAPLTAINGGRR